MKHTNNLEQLPLPLSFAGSLTSSSLGQAQGSRAVYAKWCSRIEASPHVMLDPWVKPKDDEVGRCYS